MAKCLREGKVVLSKKDKKLFIRCIKELIECDPVPNSFRQVDQGLGIGGDGPMATMEADVDGSSFEEENPVAKTFKQQGNFEEYIGGFTGLEIKPKEAESITNYTNAKPTKVDQYSIRYENSDDFSNNTITVIKKLREGNDLVFTAFQSSTQQSGGTVAEPQKPEETGENEIIVSKSRSFKDDIEGGKILADLLQKLEI